MDNKPDPKQTVDARRKYVEAFNKTLIEIWQDRIRKFGAISSWELYNSLQFLPIKADNEYTTIRLEQNYLEYGQYVDRGTGKETPKGNSGDIGRAKVRKAKPWLTKPYYRSYFNIRDFMAESLGEQVASAICSLLNDKNKNSVTLSY